ncbi:hypothetical protein LguiA_018440 [Lonicera macranthoides]
MEIQVDDMNCKGLPFTWVNKRGANNAILSRIDRVLCNDLWCQEFTNAEAVILDTAATICIVGLVLLTKFKKYNMFGHGKRKGVYNTDSEFRAWLVNEARGLELLKSNAGLAYDDWRHVPGAKKQDMFDILSARPEKLAQRLQAKDNRSKKTDAHYLSRTSYAEKEEICMSTQKRKPDRVELYVDAHKHPKTKLCHPGAISDVEQINAIRSSQDEASKGSIDTDALTQHFGKDNRGRTRGVGSSVSRTKLKATLPVRNELEKVKAEVRSTNDMMSYILKVVQGLDPSFNRESGGSHSRPNGEESGIQPTLHGSEKLATGSPSTLRLDLQNATNS